MNDPNYIIQQQAEWSGPEFADCMDVDYEADTLEEARKIIAGLPKGIVYVLYGPGYDHIEEGTA